MWFKKKYNIEMRKVPIRDRRLYFTTVGSYITKDGIKLEKRHGTKDKNNSKVVLSAVRN